MKKRNSQELRDFYEVLGETLHMVHYNLLPSDTKVAMGHLVTDLLTI